MNKNQWTNQEIREEAEALQAAIDMLKKHDEPTLSDAIEAAARHLPENYAASISVEHGAAWIILIGPGGDPVDLPDSADKTITEQLNDALCVANGFKWK